MTGSSVIHHTFSIERRYPERVDVVFAAWRDPSIKRRWFAGADAEHALDFRVGGLETIQNIQHDGRMLGFEARYLDIVESRRIVFWSTLSADGELATAAITTVELSPEAAGTLLILTESDVFVDGWEKPEWRERGTAEWLAKLGTELPALAR